MVFPSCTGATGFAPGFGVAPIELVLDMLTFAVVVVGPGPASDIMAMFRSDPATLAPNDPACASGEASA
jgi:hypothetical protein